MKFAKYDLNNFQLKISKEETKDLYDMIDNLVSADLDVQLNQTFWTFMEGLKNLSED